MRRQNQAKSNQMTELTDVISELEGQLSNSRSNRDPTQELAESKEAQGKAAATGPGLVPRQHTACARLVPRHHRARLRFVRP